MHDRKTTLNRWQEREVKPMREKGKRDEWEKGFKASFHPFRDTFFMRRSHEIEMSCCTRLKYMIIWSLIDPFWDWIALEILCFWICWIYFLFSLILYLKQSRSLLNLPAKTNGSTHSLDLPAHDQPRRASAPEGENIRIVIDDVDSMGE